MLTGDKEFWTEGTILIVEDDEGLAELIRTTLEEGGFACEHAMTGDAALERLGAATPVLMLLDYSLPDMNGLDLVNTMLAGSLPAPPYIMITGREDTRLAVSIMKQGARDYVVKDVEFLDRLPVVVKRITKEIATERRLMEAEQALRESEARLVRRDEEEREKLELQLLQTHKLESLGVLAGGIAHDFNNILTAIMGNISYARMDLDDSHQACAPLARAEKAAKMAADLARQLLIFAKGGEPVKKMISLRTMIDDAVSLNLSGTKVQGVIELTADLHAVKADEGQINQSFHNIIINAVHAMPDGGRLNVSGENVALTDDNNHCLPAGNYVRILFSDEGCGIADEDQKRIFDPYFTTKAGGTGLGLASTYAIIRKHDGQITVSSIPGMGTTFTILLPSLGEIFTPEDVKGYTTVAGHGTGSILVMDDDEMVRELAAITLRRFGYAITTCVNGSEAISLYRSAREEGNPFSLVIMDLTIPGGMGGIEAARQILAFDSGAHLIVSSGYSEDPVMANYTDYGFCASIEKPYRVEDISGILLNLKPESQG
jgi:signal transduction histidine kinase